MEKITEACSDRRGACDRSPKFSILATQVLASAREHSPSDEKASGSSTYEQCKTGRRTPQNNTFLKQTIYCLTTIIIILYTNYSIYHMINL